jgi:peptide/nickel transport system substrate-binding protein
MATRRDAVPVVLRALALAAAVGAAGCGRGEDGPSAGGATTGTTFVYARGKESPTLDPAEATDGESALVLENVYDTLTRIGADGSTLEPGLATSWTPSEDKRSMTFVLRDGVAFHDGTPCDAAAVAVNFERQRDLGHRFHFTTEGAKAQRYPYWGDMFGSVAKTTATGRLTLHVDFSEPMPPFFPSLVAMFSTSVVSPKALEKGAAFVKSHPVGTGAFRFVSKENEEVTLEANPAWWGGRPKLDRLVFVVVPDPRNAYQRLEAGQVDGIDGLHPKDVVRARRDKSIRVHQVASGLSVCYLALNNDRKPFDDVRVRRAVALAIDKARIAETTYEGVAKPIATLVPAGIQGHAAIRDRVRDVAQARSLLTEAGAIGKTVTLRFMSTQRPYVPDPSSLAAQIRDDLREAGLEVQLKKDEWNTHLRAMQNGDHEMGLLGWTADVADADNYLYVLLDKTAAEVPAQNVSFYRSEAFHERVTKARSSYDPAERHRLYAEAQQIAFDDVPLVPLVVMGRMAATRANVSGFALNPVSSPHFAGVSKE